MASLRQTRLWHSEQGAELVEFALTFPLLLLLVLGVIDFGFLFQRYEVVTNAAREGARVAVLPNYAAADVEARVEQYLEAAGLDAGLAGVTPIPAEAVVIGVGGPCMTLTGVTVTYPHGYTFVGPFMSYFGKADFSAGTLSATATMRYEGAAMACP